jgi:preprotein translocase subunit SecB
MKLSPLQLEAYFLTESSYRTNQDFNPEKEPKLDDTDLQVSADIQPIQNQERRWQVTVSIKLQPKPEANSPCSFSITVVGIVWAAPNLPGNNLDMMVRTNGPTMVYGAAREMVRDLTARGPFSPICLPSVSFLPEAATVKGTTEVLAKAQAEAATLAATEGAAQGTEPAPTQK